MVEEKTKKKKKTKLKIGKKKIWKMDKQNYELWFFRCLWSIIHNKSIV